MRRSPSWGPWNHVGLATEARACQIESMVNHIRIDRRGRLTLPKELGVRLGLMAGGQLVIEQREDGILLGPPSGSAVEIYSAARLKEFARNNKAGLAEFRLGQGGLGRSDGSQTENVYFRSAVGTPENRPNVSVICEMWIVVMQSRHNHGLSFIRFACSKPTQSCNHSTRTCWRPSSNGSCRSFNPSRSGFLARTPGARPTKTVTST